MTDTLNYLQRVLADSTDQESWKRIRDLVRVTASDAKTFAKVASIPLYAANKLKPPSTWQGNDKTASGHVWEERALAHFEIPQNTLFIHAPGEIRIGSTVDGLDPATAKLAEVKTRHGKAPTGPKPTERRQVWLQQFTLPEFETTDFIEACLDDDGNFVRYEVTPIPRDDAAIDQFVTDLVFPVLHQIEALIADRSRS